MSLQNVLTLWDAGQLEVGSHSFYSKWDQATSMYTDFDTIEEHNIPNQLFKESDIFSAKVDALLNIYNEHFNDDTQRLKVHKTEITQDNAHVLSGVVFGCVDSMAARKYIYENC